MRDVSTASETGTGSEFRSAAAVIEAERQERSQMEVLQMIPEALEPIRGQKERNSLFDSKGLGKPQKSWRPTGRAAFLVVGHQT